MTEKEKKLAEDNIELAYYIAHRWHKYSRIELDEAISCAQLGLVKAAMKFDAEKGCRFATYAYKIMENEIRMELRKRNRRREEIYFEDPIEGTDGLVLGDMIADHRDCFEALEAEDEMIRNISLLTERADRSYDPASVPRKVTGGMREDDGDQPVPVFEEAGRSKRKDPGRID